MTNRNSKGHGIKKVLARKPKSKLRNRRNKEKARVRAVARQTALREALAKGN